MYQRSKSFIGLQYECPYCASRFTRRQRHADFQNKKMFGKQEILPQTTLISQSKCRWVRLKLFHGVSSLEIHSIQIFAEKANKN